MRIPALTRRALAASALLALVPMGAFAQAWPARPVRLVVPFPAGGGTDIIAREVANKVTGTTKWNFVIENKPGSGGNLGIDNVAKSAADGYSLVLGQTSNLAINPALYSKLPYDPLKDLTPVALIGSSPLLMVVAANSPFQTLGDVVAAAKAKPGTINYATSGNGTVAHLATELFQREANVKLTHIPYKGASQGLNDVIGGNVEIYVSSVTTLIGYIKNGKVRPLAVTSAKRTDDLPQVPTVAESGYKGFEAVTWFGVLGPARLPTEVTSQLNAEVNKALRADDLRNKLESQGLELSPGTPEQFGKLIRDDLAKWGKVVKESGAKID
ncbi:tripartite tricarboxylate transporter substrate binding protein [Ramlibacter rhizophilus]|uniref:Tripartite tricarboxylate transporter substrate binding protein n=1 Tax=Ramlibacter rhizophilus TaxID=1781167 RepID=A0A4Z0BFR1_9BURK|nr:tripartite tricarboxylate transporter substrate binding protein [Ramlibacter rhizophilus]TFY97293.1 tripartite tricarboxylate transporter substrate binding protein [Ramlibacter rhizophilus]